MNIKRAISITIIISFVVYLISVIGSKLLGIDLETANAANMPTAMWYVALISVSIISTLGAIWYFRSSKIVPNIKNGLLLGLIFSIFGFIVSIILLLIQENGGDIILSYFAQVEFWMAFILIITTSSLVGYIRSKEKK